jgi:hypothetical protein
VELGTCNSPFKEYGVFSKAVPACYSLTNEGDREFCSSDDLMLSCMAQYGYSANDLIDVYGAAGSGNYFLHDTAIIIVSCVVLVFSAMFDKSAEPSVAFVDDEEGAFYQRDNLNMQRLTNVLEWVVVFLMLWSSFEFSFMQAVYCPLNPAKDDGDVATVCNNLSSCGAGVRSLIQPSNAAAANYVTIAYGLVTLLVLTMLLRLFLGRGEARVADGPTEEELMLQIEAMERADEAASRHGSVDVGQIMDEYDEQLRQHRSQRDVRFSLTGRQRDTVSARNGFVMFPTHFSADTDPFAAYLHNHSDDHEDDHDGSSDSDSDSESGGEAGLVSNDEDSEAGASAGTAVAPASPNRLLRGHVGTMASRQSLVKRWEYHDVDKVTADTALHACVTQQHECAICLGSLLPEGPADATQADSADLVVIRVPCSHWFHRNCLMNWIVSAQASSSSSRNTCPICRANLANGKQLKEASDADRIVEFD